jgi:hypothetical protein
MGRETFVASQLSTEPKTLHRCQRLKITKPENHRQAPVIFVPVEQEKNFSSFALL